VTQRGLLAAACLAIAVGLLAARPAATPGPPLRDFEAYWGAGVTWNARADPYERAIWNAEREVPGVGAGRDELLPFIGPPATLLLWSLLARLPYGAAAVVWWTILALSLLALVPLLIRAGDASVTPFSFLAALALAVAFGPITSDLALGQIALPALLGAVVLTLSADRWLVAATAGACLAFAQPNLALALSSQLGRNRATLAIVIGAITTYLLGALAAGPQWPLAYARAAFAHGGAERFVAIQLTPASIAYGFGAPARDAELLAALAALAAIAAALAIAVRVRDRFARLAAFAALLPFASGFFHEHDLTVAYPAAAWCALRARGTTRTVALAGTLLVAIDWLGLAQRPSGILQSLLLAIAAFCAFAALGERSDSRITLRVVVALAALFAAAAWLAERNPAPVWPDSLGAFRAAANATVSTVWMAEQRASGLLHADPLWAFLRLLSLLGCALLAYAITRHSSCHRRESRLLDSNR
jgi:Glycosyltransferase family 87